MTGRIKVLPPDLVAKIAAGEVVERPSSIVKELVENSLDAGALHIIVEMENGGKKLIRVSDDGCGMDREDSIRAFDRHATSKLSGFEDLYTIKTLGFRGEALASIVAVARVKLTTRPPELAEGTEVRAEGGKTTDARCASRSPGTTVEVRDLFYNVPARKKFLKGDNTESDRILEVMTSYALARPEVGFRVLCDGKEVMSYHPTESLGERIAKVYGVQVFRELLPVSGQCRDLPSNYDEYPLERCVVHGFISRPALTKGRNTMMFFLLNGRWISDRALLRAVSDAYGELLPPGRYPVAVINLEMNPALVDVNVHPAKTVVRFANEGNVHATVLDAVRQALAQTASQPHGIPGRPLEPLPFRLRSTLAKVETKAVQKTIFGVAASLQAPAPGRESGLPEITILGQAHNLYIIGQTRDGIVIIDQHAAAERVNYEKLREEYSGDKVRSQTLLSPRTLELSAREKKAFENGRELLEKFGYHVEDFGGKSIVLKAVPVVGGDALSPESFQEVLCELLDELGKPGLVTQSASDRALMLMACHKSVRAGERLEAAQLRELVASLYRAREPYSCPHGRPTIIHMNTADLRKKFGRT